MDLNLSQKALARAIQQDFARTYPGATLQMVEAEMRSQLENNPPGNGILGIWIQDYLNRAQANDIGSIAPTDSYWKAS